MHGHDARAGTESALALFASVAVFYLCFTPRGRRTLGRVEKWLEDGGRDADRLLGSAGRMVALVGSVRTTLESVSQELAALSPKGTELREVRTSER